VAYVRYHDGLHLQNYISFSLLKTWGTCGLIYPTAGTYGVIAAAQPLAAVSMTTTVSDEAQICAATNYSSRGERSKVI